MDSALYDVPVARRRRLAATLGLFAVLFVTVGIVATTGSTPGVVRVFSAIALVIAGVLALMAWGVAHSVKLELAESRLDRAIDEAMQAHGGSAAMCGCGHDHDPDEMYVRTGRHETSAGDACAHDGAGADCTHNCVTCVMRALRPSPTATREERLRSQA